MSRWTPIHSVGRQVKSNPKPAHAPVGAGGRYEGAQARRRQEDAGRVRDGQRVQVVLHGGEGRPGAAAAEGAAQAPVPVAAAAEVGVQQAAVAARAAAAAPERGGQGRRPRLRVRRVEEEEARGAVEEEEGAVAEADHQPGPHRVVVLLPHLLPVPAVVVVGVGPLAAAVGERRRRAEVLLLREGKGGGRGGGGAQGREERRGAAPAVDIPGAGAPGMVAPAAVGGRAGREEAEGGDIGVLFLFWGVWMRGYVRTPVIDPGLVRPFG